MQCENIQPVQVGGFFGSGKSSEELPEHLKKGFEVAPKSVWDPAERLKEQDRDGVSAEGLYTSMGMLLFGLDDAVATVGGHGTGEEDQVYAFLCVLQSE